MLTTIASGNKAAQLRGSGLEIQTIALTVQRYNSEFRGGVYTHLSASVTSVLTECASPGYDRPLMGIVGTKAHRVRPFGLADVLEDLFGSARVLENSQRALQRSLEARGIYFGSGLLPTYAYAFVTGTEQSHRWASRAEQFVRAAERLSKDLISDDKFCASLGVDRDALEIARIDPGYERTCVLCRPDGIPVGSDVKFVELNSDSPAMMMFLDIVAECILELDVFASLRGVVAPSRAADALLDSLVECYSEHGGSGSPTPTIAITDWEGQKTRYEHQRLAEHFEARGYSTVVCDPRAFRLVNGELRIDDRRIDLVYRRALASEIIDRRGEVEPLLEAYRDGKICMVNPLRSYLVGAKAVLSELALGEDSLVPRTLVLDNEVTREIVMASPRKWALKRSQGHGGNGVVLPEPENERSWREAIDASRNEVWIAQEYLEVPRISLPVVNRESVVEKCEKYFNWNPFVFGGRYAGGLVRVSESPLINITLGGGLLATFTT